jgi:hypothetical protein
MSTYVVGYGDGFAAAIMTMTDLVLAGKAGFVEAQARCMDFHRERLLAWRGEVPPEMERESIPFTDALPPTDADDALAAEWGIGDEGEGA